MRLGVRLAIELPPPLNCRHWARAGSPMRRRAGCNSEFGGRAGAKETCLRRSAAVQCVFPVRTSGSLRAEATLGFRPPAHKGCCLGRREREKTASHFAGRSWPFWTSSHGWRPAFKVLGWRGTCDVATDLLETNGPSDTPGICSETAGILGRAGPLPAYGVHLEASLAPAGGRPPRSNRN